MADRQMQAFRKIPGPHEPAADFRMIRLQALSFDVGERRMIALRDRAAIKVWHDLVERQHSHILQQGCEKDLFRHR